MVKKSFDKKGLFCNMVIVEIIIFLRVYQQGIQKDTKLRAREQATSEAQNK